MERSSTTADAEQTSRPPATPETASSDLAAILDGYNLGRAELARFADGQPLTAAEVELLAQILDLLPRLRYEIHVAQREGSDISALPSAPADQRGEAHQVRGHATRAEKISLPPELADRFEFRHYYRVALNAAESDRSAILYARHIPAAWPLDQPIEEPIEADALFLKLVEPKANPPSLAFAADRIAWFPTKPDSERGVVPAKIKLASLGMDIGLWDDVRESNHRPLEAGDREAFYQLLAAVGKPSAASLLPATGDPLAIGELLQRPQQFQGSVQRIAGTARRIQRIDVPDADVRARFGIDHYYEIDLFVPLGDANVRLGDNELGNPAPEFRNTYPATLVVRELSPGLTAQDNLHEQISASAVFLKIWTYDSRYTARFGQVQPAPLFITAEPRLIESPVATNWLTTALIATALGLSLATLMLALWWSARPRRQSSSSTAPPPDFSNL